MRRTEAGNAAVRVGNMEAVMRTGTWNEAMSADAGGARRDATPT
jgi:hypothetical protein